MAAVVNTCSRLPAPVYWATRTVPPVATIKIFSMMTFIESTMLTAAFRFPDELIIAVLKGDDAVGEPVKKQGDKYCDYLPVI